MDKGLDLIDIPKDERFPKNLVQTACKFVKGVQSYPGLYFSKWKGTGSETWNHGAIAIAPCVERAIEANYSSMIEARGDIRGCARVEFRSVQ